MNRLGLRAHFFSCLQLGNRRASQRLKWPFTVIEFCLCITIAHRMRSFDEAARCSLALHAALSCSVLAIADLCRCGARRPHGR